MVVHCVAGVSRSASVVLAFLVKHRGFSLKDAYEVSYCLSIFQFGFQTISRRQSTAGKAFYRAQEREVAVQRLPEQKNDGRAAVVQTSTAQRDERQAG